MTVVADILASDSAKNKSLETAACVASLWSAICHSKQAIDGGKMLILTRRALQAWTSGL